MRSRLKLLLVVAVIVTLTLVIWIFYPAKHNRPVTRPTASNQPPSPVPNLAPATNTPANDLAKTALRPLPVARESAAYQWTAGDAKDTNVIRRIAHNNLEFQRMVDENARIIQRQLVYRKETAAALIQDSKSSGQPIHEFTLPGLDGQEIQFEITTTDLNPSGQQGTFAGRVAGRLDSMVTFAFKGGREAFTVASPSDGIFLQADPREPGEIIVKSIDPATYVAGVCGNP